MDYSANGVLEITDNVRESLGKAYTYCDRQYNGLEKGWTEVIQAEKDERCSYGDFDRYRLYEDPMKGPKYYLPELMTGSDYSGDSVTKSNYRVFLEQFKEIDGIHDVYGDYSRYSVAIREDCLTEEMIEILESLANYPVIDEVDMSMLEMDLELEAWESWIKSDFQRELHKKFDKEDPYVIDKISDNKLYELFSDKMEESNTYYVHEEGFNVGVDIDRIVAAITMEDGELK